MVSTTAGMGMADSANADDKKKKKKKKQKKNNPEGMYLFEYNYEV